MIKKNAKNLICIMICFFIVLIACFFGFFREENRNNANQQFTSFSNDYMNLLEIAGEISRDKVIIDNEYLTKNDNNKYLVDVQILASKLGGSVIIDENCADVQISGRTYSLENDSKYVTSNYRISMMESLSCIKHGEASVSLEGMANILGYTIEEGDTGIALVDKFATNRLIVKSYLDTLNSCGEIGSAEGYNNLHILQYSNREDTIAAYEYYKTCQGVEYVDIDSIVTTCGVDENQVAGMQDSFSYKTWGAESMGVDTYSNYLINEVGVNKLPEMVVAVLDTGIDTDHEWFEGRIATGGANYSEVRVSSGYPYEDGHGHGTHVSGIITDLTFGNVKILPVKVMDNRGYGYQSGILLGLSHVVELKKEGLNIVAINMSIGSENGEGTEAQENYIEAIDKAYAEGILSIVAAGNEGSDTSYFTPANVENAITVSAVAQSYSTYYFPSWSNYGSFVDVCAPGQNIVSAAVGGGTVTQSGTSMATPHVTSAVALLYSDVNSGYSMIDIISLLDQTALDLGTKGWDIKYGQGLVSLEYAYAELIDDVEFSNITLECSSPFDLVLSCDTANSIIYYTIDGTVPSLHNGEIYTTPLHIESSTEVSAISYVMDGSAVKGYSKVTTMAYVFSGQDVTNAYVVDEEGSLVEYTGVLTDIIIPDKVGNIEVIGIGEYAFAGTAITSVRLPSTISIIGEYAFANCTTLESVIATNVVRLDSYAFANCTSFTNVNDENFPKLIEIGRYSFLNCPAIEEIDLSCVTYVDFAAFYSPSGNNNVTTVNMPRVEIVGDGCFLGYVNLATINLPAAEYIGVDAFCGTAIQSITLPNVKYIAAGSFYICSQLTSVNMPKVMRVGQEAFGECLQLETVSMSNIEYIGAYAFYKCMSITTLYAPKLEIVGEGAFALCEELSTVMVDNLEMIGRFAFGECSQLDEISLPSVSIIDIYAFSNCKNLSLVTLSSCIQSMDQLSFENVPTSCTFVVYGGTIAERVLTQNGYELSVINSLGFTYSTQEHGVIITGYTGHVSGELVIPSYIGEDRVVGIGNAAFVHNSNINKIMLPYVTSIGNEAFYGCSNLTTIKLPSIVTIGNYAFSKCSSLDSVDIVNCENIGTKAFFDCSSLKELELGDEILSIADSALGIGTSGAIDGFVLKGFEDTPAYDYAIANDVEFMAKFHDLPYFYYSYYSDGGGQSMYIAAVDSHIAGSIIVPSTYNGNTITAIGSSAFAYCSLITDILLPNSIYLIDNDAFEYCESLRTINLENVTQIGENAFAGCTMLESVYAPKVTEIAYQTFFGCENLREANIPQVTIVNGFAFAFCSRLHTVKGSQIVEIGREAFACASNLKNIDVSKLRIMGTEYEDSVYGNVFRDCRSIEILYLPKIQKMGTLNIPSLKKVVIGKYFTSETQALFNENTEVYCYVDSDALDCAIESGCDYVIISPAYISYNLSPTIQILKNAPLTLEIEVQGFEQTYQWYASGLADRDKCLDGFTTSQLVIDTSKVGVYKYYVKIIDWDGTMLTSNLCTVEIMSPPVEKFVIKAYVVGGGTLSQEGDISINSGESLIIKMYPNNGYYLDKVIVDMTELNDKDVNTCASEGYTFSNITSGHTITAIFEKCTYKVDITIQGDGGYDCVRGLSNIEYGDGRNVTITPQDGWHVKEVYVNDQLVDVIDNVIALDDITADCSLKVVFEENVDNENDETISSGEYSWKVIIIGILAFALIIFLPFVVVIKSSHKHER